MSRPADLDLPPDLVAQVTAELRARWEHFKANPPPPDPPFDREPYAVLKFDRERKRIYTLIMVVPE